MSLGHSRTDLQLLAEAKLSDASFLFESGRFSNAFYLAGYAVEFGLKACIARQIQAEAIPDRALVAKVFTNQFDQLVGLAGLKGDLRQYQDLNALFQANWAIAGEWAPDVRYEAIDRANAHLLVSAIGDPQNGVLQ